MRVESIDLERVFEDCFFESHRTRLIGGGREPVYLPSENPMQSPHRVIYRADYLASALHEVAHWCLAGARRRRLEDYGYWYSPDGRSAAEQAAFERAEVDPQAIEWIFSDACGQEFHLSADNLAGGTGASRDFERAVEQRKAAYLESRLPERAECYRRALERFIEGQKRVQDPYRSIPAARRA